MPKEKYISISLLNNYLEFQSSEKFVGHMTTVKALRCLSNHARSMCPMRHMYSVWKPCKSPLIWKLLKIYNNDP